MSAILSFATLALLAGTARAGLQEHANVKRQVSQLRTSYDFVIAGGGTSGLTVADRLTEAFPGSWFPTAPSTSPTQSS